LGGYGFSDGAGKGVMGVSSADGLELSVYRQVRDIGDVPVIAPLFNSIASQEFGDDYGDYYRATGARFSVRSTLGARGEWRFITTSEQVASLAVRATPATGQYRPNPSLGDGTFTTTALTVRRRSQGFAVRRDVAGEATAEVGGHFGRFSGVGHLLVPLGTSRLLTRIQVGIGTRDLPRHRAFVLGGRGTLLGDGFREWCGRRVALVHVEWRTSIPFLRLRAGPARTPGTITLAPYVASGWADEPLLLSPWRVTAGTRITLGLAAEWLGVFRLEAGYGVQSRRMRVAFDVTRDFWDIL
ncbi:MAG TPA: hypothetical protein VE714_02285, partial [Gemmatimonadales bacterium]|nr:hypothetical protein [Gemmatimonadales bacterium]